MKHAGLALMVLLAAAALAFTACCGGGRPEATPTPSPATGCVEYTDAANGFAISHPGDWGVPPQGEWPEGVLALLEAPWACGDFTSKCAVDTRTLAEGADFAEWCKYAVITFSTRPSYTLIDQGNTTLGGMDAFEHLYTAQSADGVLVQTKQLYVAADGTVWVLSCGCDAGCAEQYEPLFDTVLYSFRLLENE